MKWNSIETAPQDETRVLVFVDGYVTEGWFEDGKWDVAWLDYHGCGCCGGGRPAPTHWMTRPEDPKEVL